MIARLAIFRGEVVIFGVALTTVAFSIELIFEWINADIASIGLQMRVL